MAKATPPAVEQKLDEVISLLQHILALELARLGVTQEGIGKHLRIAKADVVAMLKGIKKENLTS